jgi:hypothetical protein
LLKLQIFNKMPKTYTTGSSTKRTTHLAMPTKKDGSIDLRYVTAQFITNSGKRDMRTTLTGNRK